MVAACINAETGVGPSMASGNQICSGNMADLPAPPIKIKSIAQVIADIPIKLNEVAFAKTAPSGFVRTPKSKVFAVTESINIPMRNPKSAKRVTINAFFDAATAEGFW